MTKLAFSFSATFKIARTDGSDIKDVSIGKAVIVKDRDDVEGIAHSLFFDKTLPALFLGYKVLQLPTETNGKLRIDTASDAAW
jgi:hypothetical protein